MSWSAPTRRSRSLKATSLKVMYLLIVLSYYWRINNSHFERPRALHQVVDWRDAGAARVDRQVILGPVAQAVHLLAFDDARRLNLPGAFDYVFGHHPAFSVHKRSQQPCLDRRLDLRAGIAFG